MVIKKRTSKIYKLNPKAKTLYLSIPTDLIKEKGFPFKAGDIIKIELDTNQQKITLTKFD